MNNGQGSERFFDFASRNAKQFLHQSHFQELFNLVNNVPKVTTATPF